MEENKEIIINDPEELYNLLPENIRDKYAIGIHGFAPTHYQNSDESFNLDKLENDRNNILEGGLSYDPSRVLLSTVKFGNLNPYMYERGSWKLGGIIVALPKVVKNKNGKEIFVGSPNEEGTQNRSSFWDRNKEPTSISELVLAGDGNLSPTFILGSYQKTEEPLAMNVKINPKHLAFNNEIVPDNEFDKIKYRFKHIKSNKIQGLSEAIKETKRQKKEYKENSKGELLPQKRSFVFSIKNFVRNAITKGTNQMDIDEVKEDERKLAIENMEEKTQDAK